MSAALRRALVGVGVALALVAGAVLWVGQFAPGKEPLTRALTARLEATELWWVNCAKALDFADASMPERARDAFCTNDTYPTSAGYVATFRMPREGLSDGLKEAFPRLRADLEEDRHGVLSRGADCDPLIGCFDGDGAGTLKPSRASHVTLRITYEDERTALVKMTSFRV
ncbi:hypothetical protein ACFCZ1_32200 [Streptomyces sp. NPDC056224]|uniref:hypothetical protein n=1 Tax=Streptomyces sp. NPDC056224 TaxID=3345750 RepID=UPI0035E01F6F